MKKIFRKDWILYEEIANEGGKQPTDLITVNVKEDNPETNKHVPFIEETAKGYFVKCGKNDYHAETAEHHTFYIDLVVDNKYHYRQYINYLEGEKPEANFEVPKGKRVTSYAFCNLHGLWKFDLKV